VAIFVIGSLTQHTVFADQEAAGVRVPKGFNITLFADDDMAHDVHSITTDSRGRVVVSGPGYIRFLIDDDKDGKADRVKEFADGPRTGAQGMFFVDRDLLFSGDNGLFIFRDDNRDDKADKDPERFLGILAGGEHHAHSIQKGPDGWWYVIAGNYAGVTDAYVKSSETSPIRKPYAGVIMRIRPDFKGGEVVADGFRNAYDFGFSDSGDIFTFDSDGERDISLPWYRPTRIFQATSRSNAGWVTRSWKRPSYHTDMPPVIGSFGRGSPSGVVVYRHNQFPEKYRNAVIGLDWTYGRVVAVPLKSSGSVFKGEPIELMTGVGTFGFAPTDAAIGRDGSLYVSIGGRGTRGGVYRVTYGDVEEKSPTFAETDEERLAEVLDAPQPLASWSRAKWERQATRLKKEPFTKTILNERLTDAQRIRAVEVVTEMFEGVEDSTAKTMMRSKSAAVRARIAWSLGRRAPATPSADLLTLYAQDKSPLVQRFAFEAMHTATEAADWDKLGALLPAGLSSDDHFVRQAAARAIPRVPSKYLRPLAEQVNKTRNANATVSFGIGLAERSVKVVPNVVEMTMRVLEPIEGNFHPASLRLECARAMQMALGDLGPAEKRPAVFEGYAPRLDLSSQEKLLNPYRTRIAEIFPTGDTKLDREVSRVIAMLAPLNDELLDKILAKLTDKSDPVDDVHYLIVAARIGVERSQTQTDKIAKALLALDDKITKRDYPKDLNWNARIGELYAMLVKYDEALPVTIAELPDFGRPSHVVFLTQLAKEDLQIAINAFAKRIEANEDYPWSNDVLFVLGESTEPAHRAIIRDQLENTVVSNAALMVLSREPEERDRELFVDSLETPDRGILMSSVTALSKLSKDDASPKELVALVRTARRLGGIPIEFQMRETVVKSLQEKTGENFGFVAGQPGFKPQTEVLAKWSAWADDKYPEIADLMSGGAAREIAAIQDRLAKTDWDTGDPGRGAVLYEKLSCAQCHGGGSALGPDLGGVTGRFSRDDLFTAIVAPNKDVSTRYQTTQVQTSDGKAYQGLVIYRSVDGVLLRTSQNQTIRIEGSDIEFSRALSTSLMPAGLLKDSSPQDLADLYSYLGTLKAPVAPAPEPSADPMQSEKEETP
jgi:putative membrane-bound dehydrogenase-like protein